MNKTPNTSRESVPQIPKELLPCPFCGSQAKREQSAAITTLDDGSEVRWHSVRCGGACIISGPSEKYFECDVQPRTPGSLSEMGATETWNKRATPSVPSPTEALTASGVSAKPDSLNAYHWTEETVLNIRSNSGDISDQQCIADAHNNAIDAAIRSEREPFIPSSPSPLVSVEEWTVICERALEEILVALNVLVISKGRRSHAQAVMERACESAVNASLASLTARIRELEDYANDLANEKDALRSRLEEALAWQRDVQEREAACCPEDVGFDELIGRLRSGIQGEIVSKYQHTLYYDDHASLIAEVERLLAKLLEAAEQEEYDVVRARYPHLSPAAFTMRLRRFEATGQTFPSNLSGMGCYRRTMFVTRALDSALRLPLRARSVK